MRSNVLQTGRWHPRVRMLKTGRFSTYGANVQGLDKRMRDVVAAPPGRQLIALDFSQMDLCAMLLVAGEAA